MKAGSQGVMSNGPQQFYLGCLGMEGPALRTGGVCRDEASIKTKGLGLGAVSEPILE